MKKKKKLSQSEIDECLLTLIHNHPSKEVAIAACAQSISTPAIRDLLANLFKSEPKGTSAFHENLQLVPLTRHVNPQAVSDTEAAWTHCLWEHTLACNSSISSSQQLHHILPMLLAQVDPSLLFQAEINDLAMEVCLSFTDQLESLKHKAKWMDAHGVAGWLSTVPSSQKLNGPNAGAKLLLDKHLPTWGAWAAWRPQPSRIRAWQHFSILVPSLQDLFALEGPDFANGIGSEQTTLREGLIAQGLREHQSTIRWGGLRPFKLHESLLSTLERLTNIIDYACSAGPEYTALITHLCVDESISNEALDILEGARFLDKPAFTTVILHVFTISTKSLGRGNNDFSQLLSALSDTRVLGLREQIKPYLVDQISSNVMIMKSALLQRLGARTQWADVTRDLLNFANRLQETPWLLVELDRSIQLAINTRPAQETIEILGMIRKSVQKATPSGDRLLVKIDTYCEACFILEHTIPSSIRDLIEGLINLWQQTLDGNRRELSLLIADLPSNRCHFKNDYLNDLKSLPQSQINAILDALRYSGQNHELGCLTIIELLANEDRLDVLERWRIVLFVVIERQDIIIVDHALKYLTTEEWFELLHNIRRVYKNSELMVKRRYPRFLDVELHTWSEQLVNHLPILKRLERVLRNRTVMRTLLLGPTKEKKCHILGVLQLAENNESNYKAELVNAILALLDIRNVNEIEEVLSIVSATGPKGIEACLDVIDSSVRGSVGLAEVVLATRLRAIDISVHEKPVVIKVLKLFGVFVDDGGRPSLAGLTEANTILHQRYLKLMSEAQRIETLRLSLKAVVPHDVSSLLARLHIESPSTLDDLLATLPPSLNTLVERISNAEIELQFPATKLTKLQRFAINAGDAESFLVRLTLRDDGVPFKFCVHLSGDSSSGRERHTPWEIFNGVRAPHEQYCHGRPNRGAYQLARVLWSHLRYNFISLEQTHAHITATLSKFGQGCLVCGQGQHRLRRATICSMQSCRSTFSQAHTEIQLAEIWQDPAVIDVLLTAIHASASTSKLDLLPNCPAKNAPAVVNMIDQLPAITTLATHLKSCLNVHGNDFRLAQSLAGYCSPSLHSVALASGLIWAGTSYRGFLVSATGSQRIPSFGNNQFLVANTAPDLEIAFSCHMLRSASTSQIFFHGTSLDRLYPILCQGLQVQSGTNQRHGALYGPGIYMADEPRVAWGYATVTRGGWKSSNLKDMKVLLGCELAGSKPRASNTGIYVITDATRLAVRYIFLLASDARMPAAKDVRLPMGSVFQGLRNFTL